jgi:subtilisin family serine protease
MNRISARQQTLAATLVGLVLWWPATTARAEDRPDTGPSPSPRQQALFERLNVAEAWKVTRGDPKVLVGVIDNGFDFFHPDLKGQLLPGYYYPGGYHTEFYENVAHGTMVASLIVARGDKGAGMAGLAPGCKVLTASQGMIEHTLVKRQRQFFRDNPKATAADFQKEMLKHQEELARFGTGWVTYQTANAADAVRYLVDHGARVINFSGGLKRSLCPSAEVWQKLEGAFAYAARKDVVLVLAAGNNAAEWDDYPGRPEPVIVVGATRLDDSRWEEEVEFVKGMKVKQGSNFGKRLTVMAPAEKVLVCVPHERRVYETDDGPMGAAKVEFKGPHEVLPMGATSCAAPVVTSLAALVRSARSDLDARAVVEVITRGCDGIGKKGYDIHTGHGRVNFGKTLQLALGWGK